MSNEWLTPQQAAESLHCSVRTVHAMLRDGILSGEKGKGQWRVKAEDITRLQAVKPQAPPPEPPLAPSLKVDPGMVEVNMALAGIAAAMAAILPGITGLAEGLRLFVAFLSGVLAVFSAYSALWLLARYCLERPSLLGLEEVWRLLTSPAQVGPYWFTALGLLIWLVLSALIGSLVVVR